MDMMAALEKGITHNRLHDLTDVAEIVRISAGHEVNFPPPEANA
jgi:hypothetical protein